MSKKLKTVLISVVSVVVAVAIVIGIVWALGRNSDPVKVVPVSMHSSNYMGNETESTGFVTAEQLQKIIASSTQTITEIFVQQGQKVKKGDKLLSYDTTLSDIQLERKQINVKQAELNLQQAKDELARINAMKPYVPPTPTEPTTEAPTEPLEPVEELAGVGRKTLHITALPFGKDGVEGQCRFSRSRQTGNYHQLVMRNLDLNVFEVMDPCPLDMDHLLR